MKNKKSKIEKLVTTITNKQKNNKNVDKDVIKLQSLTNTEISKIVKKEVIKRKAIVVKAINFLYE